MAVNSSTLTLIRGFEFKSFTRWVKVYSRVHGLGTKSSSENNLSKAG
jgi:hypothetical protein